ncbi:hypothetical protein [Brachybacterium saurashtrense]|uniref:Uncharacterized protein n=1 Tax=Brachybacterium saurashtrense TaxID=556288 RepID=A0A345YJU5_9MICO|nr:hypothetical protein [Brachybacterium saurashtrense]AXK44197.1 hypothetical protein DWV08_00190 [Brachybacterium saurashtrense]RRR21469.1 hypothetical protein DXU92_14090 [Brachybacterium saurashtrense]
MKRYARLRESGRIVDVRHGDDWALIYTRPRPPLVCPVDGCSQGLSPVELTNTTGTRFLRVKDGSQDCGHLAGRGDGGGPMTDEHLWLQMMLLKICEDLGIDATMETDYTDIRVDSSPPYALEVQKHNTDFAARIDQRKQRGMETLWLFPESAKLSTDDPVFRFPALRVRYQDEDGNELKSPWTSSCPSPSVVKFGATIWVRGRGGFELVPAGNYSARRFLKELFEGRRVWQPKKKLLGLSDGGRVWSGWVLKEDLEAVETRRKARAIEQAAAAERQRQEREQKAQLEAAHTAALTENAARDLLHGARSDETDRGAEANYGADVSIDDGSSAGAQSDEPHGTNPSSHSSTEHPETAPADPAAPQKLRLWDRLKAFFRG